MIGRAYRGGPILSAERIEEETGRPVRDKFGNEDIVDPELVSLFENLGEALDFKDNFATRTGKILAIDLPTDRDDLDDAGLSMTTTWEEYPAVYNEIPEEFVVGSVKQSTALRQHPRYVRIHGPSGWKLERLDK